MPNYQYYQVEGGEEKWHGAPIEAMERVISQEKPMFVTVLAVSKLVEGLEHDDIIALSYAGPLYFDWDVKLRKDCTPQEQYEAELLVIEKVNQFLSKLEEMKVDLAQCTLFATGGRGYHLEIPMKIFMPRAASKGVQALPGIYREIALELAVDTLDLSIYSAKRGRMWRRPNVKRENGRYKVQITPDEMRNMTPEMCFELTSQPRGLVPPANPMLNTALSALFCQAQQKIEDVMKRRKRFKPDPAAVERAGAPSIQLAMCGIGLKPGVGFQELATQLAVAANTAGMSEDDFVNACQGLVETHQSDGNRYNSEGKRRDELRRMHRYMKGNDYYEFSIGAVKVLLNHAAPDLDGIPATREEVEALAEDAAVAKEGELDEYADVAKGITLQRTGAYKDTEYGSKRLCAISFTDTHVLRSPDTNHIVGYNTQVLVNGEPSGQLALDTDVFLTLNNYNRFTVKYGHAFQGNDQDVRTLMMRFVEQSKHSKREIYTVAREGMDLVRVVNHKNPAVAQHFLIWADANGVVMPDAIAATGVELQYHGYPDPRGVYKTDIGKAPALVPWLGEGDNKNKLRAVLHNLMTCQKPELLGKLIGWYVACFWKPLFHTAYSKFPLLHVNGPAGVGKCLGKDTPVRMADGTIKVVQDVLPGQALLGPDGEPRKVLSICSGKETLYRVTQEDGSQYVVNEAHILSLRDVWSEQIVNMNVKEFYDQRQKDDSGISEDLMGWSVPFILHEDATPYLQSIEVEPIGEGEYYGFQIDGDHLFLLGDFTVTHNTEMNLMLNNFFYFENRVRTLSPSSTTFAMTQHLSASSSIPMVIDEYKPEDMRGDLHGRLKLMLRDAYNQRPMMRGGGTRDSDDYRSLQAAELAAPVVFIAEAAETESAVMERVVLATFSRPPQATGLRWQALYQSVANNAEYLGIMGQWIAANVVRNWSVERLKEEFDAVYQAARKKYMLSAEDLEAGLSEDVLRNKSAAKERSVYNHSVAQFGFQQFRKLVNDAIGVSLDDLMEELESTVFSRLADLSTATKPEYVKVLSEIANITWAVDADRPGAIRKAVEYAVLDDGTIEIDLRTCYINYRRYCKDSGVDALYKSAEPFMYAVRESPAFVRSGMGKVCKSPSVFAFNVEELARLEVPTFK